jgi:hypothetical protein
MTIQVQLHVQRVLINSLLSRKDGLSYAESERKEASLKPFLEMIWFSISKSSLPPENNRRNNGLLEK